MLAEAPTIAATDLLKLCKVSIIQLPYKLAHILGIPYTTLTQKYNDLF